MKFKVKLINIKAGGPQIAILNHHDALKLNIKEGDRIQLKKNKRKTTAVLDIAYDNKNIKPKEIGIYSEVIDKLKTKSNETISIKVLPKSLSLQYIKDKLNKKELNKEQMNQIIKDLLENKLSEIETTYFISACYTNGMTVKESAHLTHAIVNNSQKLKFNKKKIVDKHCVSGVPGNRTTMVIVPILATAGLTIPKTSSRSITSPSGTADTVEVLAPVSHSKEKIKQIVEKTNGCMVWGGTSDLASADDLILKIERPLNIDSEGLLLASIMAKKSAVDSTHVLIDIPIGPEAKIQTIKQARSLKKKFIKLGKHLKIKTKVIITPGVEPIGNGIGPALEARDVLLTLQNKGPKDLRNKSLYMAILIMQMAGIKFAKHKAVQILKSGKAYKKMQEIIKAQGGNPNIKPEDIKIGPYKKEIKSSKSGTIKKISIKEITRIAKVLGAPQDKEAGIYIHAKLKNKVKKNQTLITLYAKNETNLKYALETFKLHNTITVN